MKEPATVVTWGRIRVVKVKHGWVRTRLLGLPVKTLVTPIVSIFM